MTDLSFHATPYDISARGFYFSTGEEFDEKFQKRLPVEEYEIQFIDGDLDDAHLFNVVDVSQGNSGTFIDVVEDIEEYQKPALFYYLSFYNPGADWDDALRTVDDEVRVHDGDVKSYAEESVDSLGGVGQLGAATAERYVDHERFGRDLAMDLDPDDEGDAYYLSLSDQERGEEYVDSIGFESLGDTAEAYFDMDSFARDLQLGGDVTEFEFAGETYTTDYHG